MPTLDQSTVTPFHKRTSLYLILLNHATVQVIFRRHISSSYICSSSYIYKFFFYKIFFLFQTIRATSHYQEFTDRHSPQYFNLSFPLHFITDKFFDFPSRTSASLLKSRPKTMHAAIPDPTNKIKWPNFPSLSTDLGHSGDQRILYLGRFLV